MRYYQTIELPYFTDVDKVIDLNYAFSILLILIYKKEYQTNKRSTLHLLICLFSLFLIQLPQLSAQQVLLSEEEKSWIAENPVVTLGSDPSWAPFEWVEGETQYGLAADYIALIEEMTGLVIKLVPDLTWPDVVKGLENGTIDMASAVYYNPDRDRFLSLTPPYASWFQVFLSQKGSSLPDDLNDAGSFRVGVGEGYSIHEYLEKTYPSLNPVPFSSVEEGVLALAVGDIDAFVGNLAVLTYIQQLHNLTNLEIAGKVEDLGKNGLSMGVRNDLPVLLSIISKALYAISDRERIAISQKWFGDKLELSLPEESHALTEVERQILADIKTLRFGIDPDWAPVEYFDENGELAGITSDNLRILSDTLDVSFEVVNGLSWADVLEAMKSREIDIIPAVTRTEEREKYMLFTKPHLKLPMVIVMRDDAPFVDGLDDLEDKKIALVKGYAVQELLFRDYPDYTIIEFNSLVDATRAVANGRADAVIGNIASINLVKSEYKISGLQIAGTTPYFYDLSFGVRKDMPELVQILEKGLSSITPREKEIMMEKWTNIQVKSVIDWRIILAITVVIGLIAGVFIIKSIKTSLLQKNLLDATIESMSDAVLVVDNKNEVLRNNHGAEKLLKTLQIDGTIAALLTTPLESSKMGIQCLVDLLKTQNNNLENELLKRSNHNLEMWLSISASPLVFKHGESGVVLIIRDITTQVQRDFQLEQSRKMDAVGQLASGIAHDFNNMLTAIMGSTQVLLRRVGDEHKKNLSHIMNASKKAAELIRMLQLFSRKTPKKSTAIDVHTTIHETVFLLSRTIDKKINLESDLQAENSMIIGDDSLLQNALMNLGINSSHAMPNGGSLTYRTTTTDLDAVFCEHSPFDITPGKFILIEVIDTGCGMTDYVKKRVFEPFFTTKKVGEGTGLGLPSVYAMVEKHNGVINIYTEVNKGTAFHIYLPLSDILDEDRVEPAETIYGSGRILVVDDEEVVRIVAQQLLQSLGYDVVAVDNGQQALDILKSETFDAILLDMIMPLMNGRETYNKILEMGVNTPVVLSSGFSKEEDVEIMKQRGLFGFLHKPYQRKEISTMIYNAVKKSKENI